MNNSFFKAIPLAACWFVLTSCGGDKSPAENNNSGSAAEQAMELSSGNSGTDETTGINPKFQVFSKPAPRLRDQVNALLEDYLGLKNQLVQSSTEGAAGAAKKLLGTLENFKQTGLPEDQQEFYKNKTEAIQKHIQNTSENPDLEAQREHFSAITENMYALAKGFEAVNKDLYYQYCPMAFNNNGGYWLSNSADIKNPYFGEKMLNCGKVTEVLSKGKGAIAR